MTAPHYLAVYNPTALPVRIPEELDAFGRRYHIIAFNEYIDYSGGYRDPKTSSGHYIAYKRHEVGYLRIDDAHVSHVPCGVNPVYPTTLMFYAFQVPFHSSYDIDMDMVWMLHDFKKGNNNAL